MAIRLLAASETVDHPLRVGMDGPLGADPGAFADAVLERLRASGRAGAVIRAESFWRDASVRLEYGRTDVDSYYAGWLDTATLSREVLVPLGPSGTRTYLPALRDPASNRSVRVDPRSLPAPAVLVLAGDLLLGRGLAFDLTVHLALSSAARVRRTPDDQQWTLEALDRYEHEVQPAQIADIVISWNDPARPALRS